MPKVAPRHLQAEPPAPAGLRRIELASASVCYRLVRSHRRTLAIHVGQSGVEARAPSWAPLSEVESFMQRKARWILGRLEDSVAPPSFSWEDGARLPLLGESVRLAAAPERKGISLESGRLLIGRGRSLAGDDWRKRIIAWVREQALQRFCADAAALAARLGVATPSVRLSNAAARWGSCTVYPKEARIRLHWKLYLLPPRLIEYVITHELAHIRELNHSPRFWAQVAKLCPDYLALRRELNRRGRALPLL